MNRWPLLALGAAALAALVQTADAQVLITPDETVLVERYIVEVPTLPPAVTIEENTTLRPGSVIPDAIPLNPFAGRSDLARYSYFVSVDNKVVVVDPATRVVVRILNARR